MNAREEKVQQISEIVQKFQDSKSTVLTDYRGLNVAEVTELRKNLREAGVEYKVYKNTLVRRATKEVNYDGINDQLTGPIAIAFSNEDVVAPAKVLAEFAKAHSALEIKVGILEGNIVSVDEINDLAKLPSRDGLLSMLLSVLQAPMRNMACVVKAVADKDDVQEIQEV